MVPATTVGRRAVTNALTQTAAPRDVLQETLQPVLVAVRDPTQHKADYGFPVGVDPGHRMRKLPTPLAMMYNVQVIQVRPVPASREAYVVASSRSHHRPMVPATVKNHRPMVPGREP